MNRDTQHTRKQPAPPDLGAEAAQLRELTRQAHEAARDLRTAVTDARKVLAAMDSQVEKVTALALSRALGATTGAWEEWHAAVTAEMDRAATDLAGQIDLARERIVQALLCSRLIPDRENEALVVEWSASNFGLNGQLGASQTVILEK